MGAEWKHRPGFNALLAACDPRPQFGVLIVSELSRIGRDTVRTPGRLQLEEAGVEIHSYLSGAPISLASEAGEMATVLHSLLASFERRRARERTYDALRRRRGRGRHRRAGVRLRESAQWRWLRAPRDPPGRGRHCAAHLHAIRRGRGPHPDRQAPERRARPRPRGGTGTWAGTALRDMLRRSLYAGVRTWNRTQKGTRGGTKSRRIRATAEWLERPAPELAIVEAELWARVQARRAASGSTYLRRMNGRLIGQPSGADVESPYLLSGIAECAECGGSLVAMTRSHGRQRMPFYGCLRYHKRGVQACRNWLQIRQAVLDGAVLDVLSTALAPDVLAEAIEVAVAELRAGQVERAARRAAIAAELAADVGRERRLLDALADGDGTATAIRERLREELARRDRLTPELAELDAAGVVDTEALLRTVEAGAADLRGLLGRHVAQARQVMRQLVEGRLICQPFEDGGARAATRSQPPARIGSSAYR